MSGNYWELVNRVIKDSDVVLEVLDARFIDETRNIEIEQKVRTAGKKIILVLNKCDLADKQTLEEVKRKLKPCVFTSAKSRLGTTILRKTILDIAKMDYVNVGVVGYPNTGKSSIINALKGRTSAKTSSVSGYTRAIQLIKKGRIAMIDTPGVLPYEKKDETMLALMGAKNAYDLKDPDLAAVEVLKRAKNTEKCYKVQITSKDSYDMLEELALKKGKIKKGGEPDIISMSRIIINDWQKGNLY